MIDSAYRELFSETVQIAAPVGLDAYGKRSWGAASAVPAHTEMTARLMRDESGREVTSQGRIFLYGVFDITTDHLLVTAAGASPVIIAVEQAFDEQGAHHTVIRFGNTQR